MAPLFVPLRAEHFRAFAAGVKRVEWRAYGSRWNRQSCHRLRRVVLSLGYSGARLLGVVLRTRRVRAELAPAAAQAIYPGVRYLCAIHVALDSDGMPRNARAISRSPAAGPQ